MVYQRIFTPEPARKVVDQPNINVKKSTIVDHPMNMWQIENLTQYQHKSEYQSKEKDLLLKTVLPDYTYWITARTSNTWPR